MASGGPSRSVPALAESQSRFEGLKITVLYQDRGNPMVQMPNSVVEYQALSGSVRGWHSTIKPGESLIYHLHGLWSPELHHAAKLARSKRIPYVVSARGMLADWALGHKALKKKVAWKLYQQRDLKNASCLLASTKFEQQDIEALLPGSRVVAIPNGCATRPADIEDSYVLPGPSGIRWALAMGRLHPVKGYAELIEAWASFNPPGWKLAIAGPDEAGYRATLESLIAKHGLADRVFLIGEVDDARKWSLLDQCELFVAPSKTENFGMAIAEALQSGTPVITTTGTPWCEIQAYNCGWWIERDTGSFTRSLKEAMALEAEALKEKGARGRKLITEKYSWQQAAARTIELYRSILISPC